VEASEAEGLGDGGWGEGQVLKLYISMLVYEEGSPLLHEFAVPTRGRHTGASLLRGSVLGQ